MHSYSVSKRQAPRVSLWRALLTCRSSPDRASPKRATSVKCERVWRCGLCPCRSFSREGVRGRRRRQQQRMDTLLRFQRSSNFFIDRAVLYWRWFLFSSTCHLRSVSVEFYEEFHIIKYHQFCWHSKKKEDWSFIGCEESFITIKHIWHSYLVLSLDNCTIKLCTETDLIHINISYLGV